MTLSLRTKRLAGTLAMLVVLLLVAALIADRWLWPLPQDTLHRPHGQFVYARDGRLLNAYTSPDRFWRKPVTLDELSPRLRRCVIACEDQWFYYHPGVNPVSLVSAAIDNLRAGRIVRGGSTITMQIARMMEPKERTILGKLQEIGRAMQLEWHYSKDELLEIYFNLVPYGGNIEGAGAATRLYFEKEPDQLSWSECAILAAIPVSPNANRPDQDTAACRVRRDRILTRLLELEVIDTATFAQALAEEIPASRCAVPATAPHFCQSLAGKFPDRVNLRSTLAPETQAICQTLATRHVSQLRQKDIDNIAVVVLDNTSGEIIAMVGNPDFDDTRHQGQINGALAPRSPGSALKPFVYALALDSGLLSPEFRLPDIPVSYSGYSPENYDREYHGMVSVREALIQSFNVPAVRACALVGLEPFYQLLCEGGLHTLRGKYYDYGLPLVLGACEVRLLDLSNLYATLARRGTYRPVRWTLDTAAAANERLLSPEASYLISDILVDLRRPDLPASWEFTADQPTVAWKTGTSYGRRDAWAIGYDRRFTVGVWAGNFSGAGSVDIVGAEIAAPLMLDIFSEIAVGESWFTPPPGIREREVCAVSGKVPGEFCPHTVTERYIEGCSPVGACDIHRMILVDSRSGKRVRRGAVDSRFLETRIAVHWPPRVAAWLEAHGGVAGLPPADPEVGAAIETQRPVIVSPDDRAEFVLIDGIPAEYQRIRLSASAPSGCSRLHWFVDKAHLATCAADEALFYAPSHGRHELLCVDDWGRSHRVTISVK